MTKIRPACPADADAIVAVIRDGFAPAFQAMMIYGCTGMSRFIHDHLVLPDRLRDTHYTVAEAGGHVVGAIEMRNVGPDLLLNYIAVDPAHRSGGLARRLLLAAAAASAAPHTEAIALDVLTSNDVARSWYERLGFSGGGRTVWWSIPQLQRPRVAETATVPGYPEAEAAHARFGFSQLNVSTPEGRYVVGRLGDQWFRLTSAPALADPDLLSALHRLAPQRALLALLPDTGGAPAGGTCRATTSRMRAPWPALRALLER